MACVSDDLRFLAEVASEARSAKSSSRSAATLTSISASSSLFRQKGYKKGGADQRHEQRQVRGKKGKREKGGEKRKGLNVPIVLELQLQLQTLDFYFSLSFVLQNPFVWLPVFGRCNVPRRSTLGGGFVRPEDRQVALDVTIRTARKHKKKKNMRHPYSKTL